MLNTVYTFTPLDFPNPSQMNLPLNDFVIAIDQANIILVHLTIPEITIQPADNSNNIISDKQFIKIMTSKMVTQSIRYTKIRGQNCIFFR